jgi:hypothetical protein
MRRFIAYFGGVLTPADRWGAVLFGLIMAMITAVTALSFAVEDDEDTDPVAKRTAIAKDVLVAVIGCNVAWGIIQGWMYVNEAVFERSRVALLYKKVQEAPDEERAAALIREEYDSKLEKVVSEEERARMYQHILGNMKAADLPKARVKRDDLVGAVLIFVLITATVIPTIVSFLCNTDPQTAVRVSNRSMLVLLFCVGFLWARTTNMNRWLAGVSILFFGGLMVLIGELLGG